MIQYLCKTSGIADAPEKGVHLIGDGRVRCLRLEEEAFANSTEELEHEDDDLVQTGRLESGEESRDPG